MTLAQRLAKARKSSKLTQAQVAEKLDISFQAVSSWERGESTPEIDKLADIAKLYEISLDWLLTGKMDGSVLAAFQDSLSDRMFDENRMYTYVKTYATLKRLVQTSKALPYARTMHNGQVRKGNDNVPYIYHPLLIACHALALGLDDDNMISTALLHDVCEDCEIEIDDLPADDMIKEAVGLLTKKDGIDKAEYFERIATNPIASIIKLLDRCNNISGMTAAFSKEKIVEYINETEEYIYPLLEKTKNEYPMYSNQVFLIKYHMISVIDAIKRQY